MDGRIRAFIDALARLEADGAVDPIAALFADGATIANPMVAHPAEGQGGPAAFWRSYRATFDAIASEFRTVVEAGEVACLEWVSTGTIKGAAIRYGGVSVLEYGDGGIAAFRTYFDPAPLTREMDAGR